jgi:hypothetical protein
MHSGGSQQPSKESGRATKKGGQGREAVAEMFGLGTHWLVEEIAHNSHPGM